MHSKYHLFSTYKESNNDNWLRYVLLQKLMALKKFKGNNL